MWTTPIMRLAEVYDISDVGLAKTCRRMRVPRPPVGYWQRIAAGQKVARPKLSPIPRGASLPQEVAYLRSRVEAPTEVEAESTTMQRVREFEAAPENKIEVPEDLRSAPEVVRRTASELRARKRDHPFHLGIAQRVRVDNILDVRASETALPRAMRIMAALVKGLEKRGLTVVADPPKRGPIAPLWERDCGHSWGRNGWRPALTLVLFADEYVRLILRELTTRPKPAPAGSMSRGEGAVGKGLFVLSACFSVSDSYPEATWKESPTRLLDETLNNIVGDLHALVEERREKRARWAEEARLRQLEETRRWQRERRRSAIATRDKQLVEAAHAFVLAKEILAYADAISRRTDQTEGAARERGRRAIARLRRTGRRLCILAVE